MFIKTKKLSRRRRLDISGRGKSVVSDGGITNGVGVAQRRHRVIGRTGCFEARYAENLLLVPDLVAIQQLHALAAAND